MKTLKVLNKKIWIADFKVTGKIFFDPAPSEKARDQSEILGLGPKQSTTTWIVPNLF